jgi:predicted component of type VI protein secretion system
VTPVFPFLRQDQAMEVKLVVVGGKQAGTEVPIPTRRFLIGRGEECHLRPHSKSVSRKHCAIVVEEGVAAIEDFDSTNGTFVNGERVHQRRELNNGDRITIHRWEFEVRLAVSGRDKTKPKPKGHVQEAAAPTVTSPAVSEDDLDISSWLEKGPDEESVIWPVKDPDADEDTVTGASLTESAGVPAPPGKEEAKAKEAAPAKATKAKEKTPAKVAGRFQNAAKPAAESSGTAASDMLKSFFSKKR